MNKYVTKVQAYCSDEVIDAFANLAIKQPHKDYGVAYFLNHLGIDVNQNPAFSTVFDLCFTDTALELTEEFCIDRLGLEGSWRSISAHVNAVIRKKNIPHVTINILNPNSGRKRSAKCIRGSGDIINFLTSIRGEMPENVSLCLTFCMEFFNFLRKFETRLQIKRVEMYKSKHNNCTTSCRALVKEVHKLENKLAMLQNATELGIELDKKTKKIKQVKLLLKYYKGQVRTLSKMTPHVVKAAGLFDVITLSKRKISPANQKLLGDCLKHLCTDPNLAAAQSARTNQAVINLIQQDPRRQQILRLEEENESLKSQLAILNKIRQKDRHGG